MSLSKIQCVSNRFVDIPDDLFGIIIRFVDGETIRSIHTTCKEWKGCLERVYSKNRRPKIEVYLFLHSHEDKSLLTNKFVNYATSDVRVREVFSCVKPLTNKEEVMKIVNFNEERTKYAFAEATYGRIECAICTAAVTNDALFLEYLCSSALWVDSLFPISLLKMFTDIVQEPCMEIIVRWIFKGKYNCHDNGKHDKEGGIRFLINHLCPTSITAIKFVLEETKNEWQEEERREELEKMMCHAIRENRIDVIKYLHEKQGIKKLCTCYVSRNGLQDMLRPRTSKKTKEVANYLLDNDFFEIGAMSVAMYAASNFGREAEKEMKDDLKEALKKLIRRE